MLCTIIIVEVKEDVNRAEYNPRNVTFTRNILSHLTYEKLNKKYILKKR